MYKSFVDRFSEFDAVVQTIRLQKMNLIIKKNIFVNLSSKLFALVVI